MFILDIETLGVESTSVVLSLAVCHVTPDTDTYQKMLDNSIFIKFSMKEQIAAGRTVDQDTCAWWDRQAEIVKEASLYPKDTDLSVFLGIGSLRVWLKEQGLGSSSVFSRGALDPLGLDSLCRTFDVKCPVRYNKFYDVRTAIDFTYDSAVDGYVEVDSPGFETSMVIKHHPVHDCAYDGMMLTYGK